jgi:hypothetical protein
MGKTAAEDQEGNLRRFCGSVEERQNWAREIAGCFTVPMLERRCIIGKKMTGIDPVGTVAERKNAEKSGWISIRLLNRKPAWRGKDWRRECI